MNPKLLKLLDAINKKKVEVKDLVGADKLEEATAAKDELKTMQQKFDLLKDLEEQDLQDKAAQLNANGEIDGAAQVKPAAEDGKTNAVKEFATAARAGFRVSNAAISTGMREGSDPDGGYTVPEDIQTQINQYKNAEFSLESLISVEPTTKTKGRRTYEKKSTMTGFQDIEEGGELQEMDTPQFEPISYTIQDRGGWLPLTNDLLSDTDANITATVTRWIARKSNATSNTKIISLINDKAAEEIETMDEIMKAIIVTLGAAYREGSKIVTNDDGLFFLATLKDTTGRALLNPNPMDTMKMNLSVGPINVPIISVPNAVIASDKSTAQKRKIPFVCGDLLEAFKKYDRQQTTLLSSNIAVAGTLNAFTQNLTLVRAIERNDFKTIDKDAFVNLSMVIADTTVTGE